VESRGAIATAEEKTMEDKRDAELLHKRTQCCNAVVHKGEMMMDEGYLQDVPYCANCGDRYPPLKKEEA